MEKRYAIMVTGDGKKTFCGIVKLVPWGTTPYDGRRYPTIDAARDAARDAGIKIEMIGTYHDIINA